MNNKGFGIRDVMVFLAIICLCILMSMIIFRRTFTELFDSSHNKVDETYVSIEKDLERICKTYTDNYYGKILEDGDSGVVTIRDMQGESLLTVVRDITDDNVICSGYVTFEKVNGTTNYKTYLRCGENYETGGYQSKYDEPVKSERQVVKERIK
ncbi:MAG: hypothetical protein IKE75_02870 [Bacilli bacterium]|nr:hypothetical protein [Bacilli bacterium]